MKSFWYDAAVAGEEADCPWKVYLQNYFVAETFPPPLAYKEKHSGSCFHLKNLRFRPFTLNLEHS